MGTILGVTVIRTIVFWGLYWGPLILGDYHLVNSITQIEFTAQCNRLELS